jgi:hypothetical protein
MDIVFAFVLLVMAAALVLLFAMMGALASRVPDPDKPADRSQSVRPLEEARLGHSPAVWPTGLSRLASADKSLLLVLSTACGSCVDVAKQLSGDVARDQAGDIAVLVSCPGRDAGEDFVHRHGLAAVAHLVDEGGAWVKSEFNVMMSPTGLVFQDGRLESALMFADLDALRTAAFHVRDDLSRPPRQEKQLAVAASG